MSLWAVGTFRDEGDIVGAVLRHLRAHGVDGFVLADHMSRDNTLGELWLFQSEAKCPVLIERDRDPAWYQSDKMTRLARIAGEQGATWIIPFDADEVWYPTDGTTLAEYFHRLDTYGTNVAGAATWEHLPRPGTSGLSPWRRECPKALPKVAFRWNAGAVIHEGNHGVSGVAGPTHYGLGIREFQYRSFEQLRRKVRQGKEALDAATRLDPTTGAHWRRLGALDDYQLEGEWQAMTHSSLVYDPAPWRPLGKQDG